MNIESKFPGLIKKEELVKLGGKPIRNMNYFQLELESKIGIYEPFYEKGKEVDSYSLRKVVEK